MSADDRLRAAFGQRLEQANADFERAGTPPFAPSRRAGSRPLLAAAAIVVLAAAVFGAVRWWPSDPGQQLRIEGSSEPGVANAPEDPNAAGDSTSNQDGATAGVESDDAASSGAGSQPGDDGEGPVIGSTDDDNDSDLTVASAADADPQDADPQDADPQDGDRSANNDSANNDRANDDGPGDTDDGDDQALTVTPDPGDESSTVEPTATPGGGDSAASSTTDNPSGDDGATDSNAVASASPVPSTTSPPPTPRSTATPTPATPTTAPEPTVTPTSTSEPTATPTLPPEPTATPAPTPTPVPTSTPVPTATPTPTVTPTPTPSYDLGVANTVCPTGRRAQLEHASLAYVGSSTGWGRLFDLVNEQDGPFYFETWEPGYPNEVSVEVALAEPALATELRIAQDPFTPVSGDVTFTGDGGSFALTLAGTDGWQVQTFDPPVLIQRFVITRDQTTENVMEVLICVPDG